MRKLMLFGVLAVAACGPRMSTADQCSSYGFQPGTVAHANCQMQVNIADDQDQQRRSASMMRMGNQMMQTPPPNSPAISTYRMPSGRVVHCTTVGTMTNCN